MIHSDSLVMELLQSAVHVSSLSQGKQRVSAIATNSNQHEKLTSEHDER